MQRQAYLPEIKFELKLREGIKAYRDEDFEAAITLLTDALQLNSQHEKALFFRGSAHFAVGHLNAAILDYELGLSLTANNQRKHDFHHGLGTLFYKKKEYDKTNRHIENKAKLAEILAIFYLRKAYELSQKGDAYFHTALVYYKKCVDYCRDNENHPAGIAAQQAIWQVVANMAVCKLIDETDLICGEELGQGSYAMVYKGEYQGLTVAIKEINRGLSYYRGVNPEVEENVILFLAEANVPYIIKSYGHFVIEESYFIIMEFAERGSLYGLVKTLTSPQQQQIMIGLAYAVECLHRNNIIHRDIKNENILIDAKFTPKLADFGLSWYINENPVLGIRGTPLYFAPELLRSQKYALDEQKLLKGEQVKVNTSFSDMYALACAIWEMLARKHAIFEAEKFQTRNDLYRCVVTKKKRESIDTAWPTNIKEVLEQTWCDDPFARLSASAVVKKLLEKQPTKEEAAPHINRITLS